MENDRSILIRRSILFGVPLLYLVLGCFIRPPIRASATKPACLSACTSPSSFSSAGSRTHSGYSSTGSTVAPPGSRGR